MAGERILVVDDDPLVLVSLAEFLRLEGYAAETARTFQEASAHLAAAEFHVLISDVAMPEVDGFGLLKLVRTRYPETAVIMVTGYGTIENAVEAMKSGAFDYLTKPIIDGEIKVVVERAIRQQSLKAENRSLRKQLMERYSLSSVVGHDYKMIKVFDLIEAVADTPTTVLITGESGTGKSLVARAIHQQSNRRDKPFIEVACGALPESLLESELFGHVRGSFTGAVADKAGKFKLADGGTAFLDEIATATPALQVKLLRVLQDLEFESVGGTKTERVDVRCILATNRDLSDAVEKGQFRQDLYYRINVVSIHLPPLRERIGDIPLLADHFLKAHCERTHRTILGFQPEAMQRMQAFPWPGNVRQLENLIERAVVLSKNRYLTLDDLPDEVREPKNGGMPAAEDTRVLPLKDALEIPEKALILRALKSFQGSRQATADALGINRTTLFKKMRRFGIEG
jgi:DNA-binding NtrC family response regulator